MGHRRHHPDLPRPTAVPPPDALTAEYPARTVTSSSKKANSDPADGLADVVLYSDQVAYPNERL